MFDSIISPKHRYYLFASGIKFKSRYFNTRREANIAMDEFCLAHNIQVECREYDKHERVYTNHKGIRFYINRI